MEKLQEISISEMSKINGGHLDGATFAYRIGEGIRFLGHAQILGYKTAYLMVYSWQ